MGARYLGGKGLSYRDARQTTWAGGIHSLESIPGLHKRLKIRALHVLNTEVHFQYGLILTGANVFCFLSSLPLLPQPPRQCLAQGFTKKCRLSWLSKRAQIRGEANEYSCAQINFIFYLWFDSFLTSLYSYLTLYRRCGLAYPHDWRGFVGVKKKMSII